MRIFDVPWINHDGSGIFSIDIHPNGKKLATAGQDQSGAGLLLIWSLEFLFEENIDACDAENSGHLARIPHSKSINCVRWCKKDGRRLVCAGDDSVICVYECVGSFTSLGTLGSNSSKSKSLENYRCVHMLYGHSLDVLHVDWSPDGRYLASCSLDNSVIVWNAERFPEKVVVLKHTNGGHTRGVKGLSWDPIGRFLATQAEDNTLKLWQTDSWECVRNIQEPFQESTSSTLFMRMDWSPDGSYLVCPCAMNNGGPTANIVIRKDWSHPRDFVGFRKAVSCVRANPRCFSRERNESGQRTVVSCFATGCRNRSLAIWLVPSIGRPLLVLEKLFKLSVLDLSWNDLTLAACSNDGVVRILCFNESEIGEALSTGEMVSLSEKIYGFLPDVYKTNNTPTVQTTLLNDNFVYSAWHDAFVESLRNKSNNFQPPTSSKNIFQQKRKISTDHLERMIVRTKKQRRTTELSNGRSNALAERSNVESSENSTKLRMRPERRLMDRCSREGTFKVFTCAEMRPQIVAKTSYWRVKSRVSHLEALNNYSLGYNCPVGFLKSSAPLSPQDSVTQITAFGEQSERLWSIYTPHLVSHMASNSLWTCFVSFNGHFSCHSTRTGRLIFLAIADSPTSVLILYEDLCVQVTCNGCLISWDLKNGKCRSKPLSSVFDNEAQHLFLRTEPKLEALLSDFGAFVDENDSNLWTSTKSSVIVEFLKMRLTQFYF